MIVTLESIFARCIPVPECGCLLWTGAWSSVGYGNIWDHVNKVYTQAHREVARIIFGIPEGMFVCHRCDTPACCNPSHLFIGTCADNTRDMVQKGRERWGEWQLSRTHCPQGHPYSGDNLVVKDIGRPNRSCRTCLRECWKAYSARRRAGLSAKRVRRNGA